MKSLLSIVGLAAALVSTDANAKCVVSVFVNTVAGDHSTSAFIDPKGELVFGTEHPRKNPYQYNYPRTNGDCGMTAIHLAKDFCERTPNGAFRVFSGSDGFMVDMGGSRAPNIHGNFIKCSAKQTELDPELLAKRRAKQARTISRGLKRMNEKRVRQAERLAAQMEKCERKQEEWEADGRVGSYKCGRNGAGANQNIKDQTVLSKNVRFKRGGTAYDVPLAVMNNPLLSIEDYMLITEWSPPVIIDLDTLAPVINTDQSARIGQSFEATISFGQEVEGDWVNQIKATNKASIEVDESNGTVAHLIITPTRPGFMFLKVPGCAARTVVGEVCTKSAKVRIAIGN